MALVDFDEMSKAYLGVMRKQSYEELLEEIVHLKKELFSANSTIHSMSVLLQRSVENVLRLARERTAEDPVTLE